jgi:hypothetical protein
MSVGYNLYFEKQGPLVSDMERKLKVCAFVTLQGSWMKDDLECETEIKLGSKIS